MAVSLSHQPTQALDRAVLAHEDTHAHARIPQLAKVDEIPFDFERRRWI